jgi:hypothetical protein
MRRTMLILVLVAVLGTFLTGCGPRVPSDPPAISGTVSAVTPNGSGNAGAIMVEGSGSIGDKASLDIGGTTPILRTAKDGTVTSGVFADLKVGVRVNVWVDGPVRESYPVQAAASVIVIVD